MDQWVLSKKKKPSSLNPKGEKCEECQLVLSDRDIRAYQEESGLVVSLPRLCEWCAEKP